MLQILLKLIHAHSQQALEFDVLDGEVEAGGLRHFYLCDQQGA